ncbi:MAG: hypothetical protein KatS3mg102_2713 [Planctomycetota bacterium]|nr:MAG: hypothetical protein KatS3mg102_2713 [Planctomycetota bacterium]
MGRRWLALFVAGALGAGGCGQLPPAPPSAPALVVLSPRGLHRLVVTAGGEAARIEQVAGGAVLAAVRDPAAHFHPRHAWVSDALPVALGTGDALHPEHPAAVFVFDGRVPTVSALPLEQLVGFWDRLALERDDGWYEPEACFAAPQGPLFFLETVGGLVAVEVGSPPRVREPQAAELWRLLAALGARTPARLAVVRALCERGERARLGELLPWLLAELVHQPHVDRAFDRAAWRTIAEGFADEPWLATPHGVRRLLEVYLRYDRSRVRALFAEELGGQARAPLRAILRDEAEPPALRIAAASCLMALGRRERAEAFRFALERLDDPDPHAREESLAVVAGFGWWEMVRQREAVEAKVMAALDGPFGDRAMRLVQQGLADERMARHLEPRVLEQLGAASAPAARRRALLLCLAAPRARAAAPRAVGQALLAALARAGAGGEDSGEALVRAAALAALAELRRQLEGGQGATAIPFADEAAARAWWERARERLG